jgi:hypothetical protein
MTSINLKHTFICKSGQVLIELFEETARVHNLLTIPLDQSISESYIPSGKLKNAFIRDPILKCTKDSHSRSREEGGWGGAQHIILGSLWSPRIRRYSVCPPSPLPARSLASVTGVYCCPAWAKSCGQLRQHIGQTICLQGIPKQLLKNFACQVRAHSQ